MAGFVSRRRVVGQMPTYKTPLTALIALALLPAIAHADPYDMVPLDDLELTVGRTIDPSQAIMLSDTVDGATTEVTYNFPADAGETYVISTELGTLTDTVLELRGADNTTLLATNDDRGGGSLASRITWTAQATETLHVRVRAYHPSQTGRFAVGVNSWWWTAPCDALLPCEIDESVSAGGERWYAFWAHDNDTNQADAVFGLATSLGTLPDTTLGLYDVGGAPLGYNDDSGYGALHSGLLHTVPRAAAGSRLRFVRVAPYSSTQTGSFSFALSSNDAPADVSCETVCLEAQPDVLEWIGCMLDHCIGV